MNLSGTVIIAFISINFGPTARDKAINNQQKMLAKNNGPAKAEGSPS
jgi:hypothetical protein